MAEKNTVSIGASGLLLWNRLIWLTVGAAFLLFACFHFSFAERCTRARSVQEDATDRAPTSFPAVSFVIHEAPWTKFLASAKTHFLGIVKSTAFGIILLAALLVFLPPMIARARNEYFNTLPVTYSVLQIITSSLYLFFIVTITYYAGVLVWRDRDQRMDEIVDSSPPPSGWLTFPGSPRCWWRSCWCSCWRW